MDIFNPSFPAALFAIPILAVTLVVALRATPPGKERPGFVLVFLTIGFIGIAASYPTFIYLSPVATLTVIVASCSCLHFAMWLARNSGEEISPAEEIPAPLDPDLIDLNDIDWGGFDRARNNWQSPKVNA